MATSSIYDSPDAIYDLRHNSDYDKPNNSQDKNYYNKLNINKSTSPNNVHLSNILTESDASNSKKKPSFIKIFKNRKFIAIISGLVLFILLIIALIIVIVYFTGMSLI